LGQGNPEGFEEVISDRLENVNAISGISSPSS